MDSLELREKGRGSLWLVLGKEPTVKCHLYIDSLRNINSPGVAQPSVLYDGRISSYFLGNCEKGLTSVKLKGIVACKKYFNVS